MHVYDAGNYFFLVLSVKHNIKHDGRESAHEDERAERRASKCKIIDSSTTEESIGVKSKRLYAQGRTKR